MVKDFDEFVNLWKKESLGVKVKDEFKDYLFLMFFPQEKTWTLSVEKQAQTLALMLSGGPTGGSVGHDIQFCYRSEIHEHLLKSKHTHAMIVSVGMVFDMVGHHMGQQITPITDFFDFVRSNEFCKAHIIARPYEPAFLHYQHINLNLDKWRENNCPDMNQRWTKFKRSPDNFHDDYTPPWIDISGLPRIINFTKQERSRKSFSYFRDQDETWKNLHKVSRTTDDYYFSRFMTRITESYYIFNTESLREIPIVDFDVIFSPTAGYSAEANCNRLNFDKRVIFYDYNQQNIDLKKMVVDLNMSLEEINILRNTTDKNMVDNIGNAPAHDRIQAMGTFEELRAMQAEMYDRCDIEYWLMDLINDDYGRIKEAVKDKVVFFDASNIFGYHINHAFNTLDKLVDSYYKLHEVLSQSKQCWFQGTKPTKQWERQWIS